MALNNNILFNAAFAGFMEGALNGQLQPNLGQPAGGPAFSYTNLVAAAVAFATQVDADIPFDAAITTAAGTPTALVFTAGSNAVIAPQVAKTNLLRSLARGVTTGRYSTDATQADWTAAASEVATIYSAATADLQIP